MFYTGWVTFVTILVAALSVALLHGLPSLLPGSSIEQIEVLRFILLVFFAALIFIVGWKTNQKKVMRAGFKGKPVEGSPNTIFFIPLQYWSLFYLILIGNAIVAWTNKELLLK